MRNALGLLGNAYWNNKDFYDRQLGRVWRIGFLTGCLALAVLLVWRCNRLNAGPLFEHSPDGVLTSAAMTAGTVILLLTTAAALVSRRDGRDGGDDD